MKKVPKGRKGRKKKVAPKPAPQSRWIKADGTEEDVFPAGKLWTMEELRLKVGGVVEWILCPDLAGQVFLANENGTLESRPYNDRASLLSIQRILGDVMVIQRKLCPKEILE